MALPRSVPLLLFVLVAGCSPSSHVAGQSPSAEDPGFVPGAFAHLMPQQTGSNGDVSVPVGTHLDYNGGPVLSNVRVVQVLYGAGTYAPEVSGPTLGGFYAQVTNSAFIDWLSEYNTTLSDRNGNPGTQQTIGRGSFAGQVQLTPSAAAAGPSLSDGQLQTELDAQLTSGALPAADANTVYMVNFPRGFQIQQGSTVSCKGFCAYHGSFLHQGKPVFYGVLPDNTAGSGCDVGCGSTSVAFDNLTMVASHEVVESITDADVGRNNLAWYDGHNGEIGDICSGLGGFFTGTDGVVYAVQKMFSNQVGDCILSKAPAADFTLGLSPATQTLNPGGSIRFQVTASGAGSGPISLRLSGLPQGVTASFDLNTLSPGGTANLTLLADASAPVPTTFSLSVTGTDSSGSQTATGAVALEAADSLDSVVNGGFEMGRLIGWSTVGVVSVMNWSHTGRYALMVGSPAATQGDSSASQTFTVKAGASTLSFWYSMNCRDTVRSDWATVTLADTGVGTVQTLLPPTCANAGWVQVTAPVTPGHTYTLTLTNHDDGNGVDPTYTLFDDVSVEWLPSALTIHG